MEDSPEDVLKLATYYGVDLGAQEFWLLAIVKEAVAAPVLPPWELSPAAAAGTGTSQYVNTACAPLTPPFTAMFTLYTPCFSPTFHGPSRCRRQPLP